MTGGLLTPDQVASLLGVRDRRTVRRRLTELRVPVVPFGRSYRVRPVDLERGVATAACLPAVSTAGGQVWGAGSALAPGSRLWDDPPANQVSPRRDNARARGTRDGTPVQHQATNGLLAAKASPPRAQTREVP